MTHTVFDKDSVPSINRAVPAWNAIPLQSVAQSTLAWLKSLAPGELYRYVPLVLVFALAIGFSRLSWSTDGLEQVHLKDLVAVNPVPVAPPIVEPQQTGPALALPTQLLNLQDDVLYPQAVPHTIIPRRERKNIEMYTVQSGDSIYAIAAKYGLAPETVMWSNAALEENPDVLQVGQELAILPVNGVYHQVGPAETLESIAKEYKVEVDAIVDYALNALNPEELTLDVGQWVIVPGGSKPYIPRAVAAYAYNGPVPISAVPGSGAFAWPASGPIYQGYWSAHPAIDIAAYLGAPVFVADSGYVIMAGWDDMYGYYVVVDHINGYQTLYAHMQSYYVSAGAVVSQGQQIGEVGSTGNSTGPHLHFEIRQGTVLRNPIGFLP